jgi:hypothetical protein
MLPVDNGNSCARKASLFPAYRAFRCEPAKKGREFRVREFRVSLADAQDRRIQWTTPFIGAISAFTAAETWMLY